MVVSLASLTRVRVRLASETSIVDDREAVKSSLAFTYTSRGDGWKLETPR